MEPPSHSLAGRHFWLDLERIGRPAEDEKVDKLSTFHGSAATAKEIAQQSGVNEKTIRNAADFTVAKVPKSGKIFHFSTPAHDYALI